MGRRRIRFGADGQPLPAGANAEEAAADEQPMVRTLARPSPPASLADTALSVQAAKQMVELVQQIAKEVMVEGRHYGKPPGAKRAMLYQAGAQILDVTFRLCPSFEVIENVRNDSYLETTVRCTLTHIPSGQVFATAIGSANSLEDRYQKQVATRQVSPYDLANTLLKIAAKRAHQTATINATAAGDIFAPDLDEDPEAGAKILVEESGGARAAPTAATAIIAKMETGRGSTGATPPAESSPQRLSDGQHAAILERMAKLGQSTADEKFHGYLRRVHEVDSIGKLSVVAAEGIIRALDERLARQLEGQAKKVAGEMGLKTVATPAAPAN